MRPTRSPRALPRALAAVVALGALGCDAPTYELSFDRGAVDLTRHVFPTDEHLGADGPIDGFSELQLAELPFLAQLRVAGLTAYGAATVVRLPFTPSRGDASGWIDPASLDDAVRVYRVSADPAERVPLASARVDRRTNSGFVTPFAPWQPGTYAVIVLDGRVRTRGGDVVGRSPDYARVVREGDPRTDPAVAAVAAVDPDVGGRADTLAAFTFTVGDGAAPLALLERYVGGKLAVDRDGADALLEVTPLWPAADRQIAAGDAQVLADTPQRVAALFAAAGLGGLPTDAVRAVVTGGLSTPSFVSDTVYDDLALYTNGTFLGRDPTRPFATDNPLALSRAAPFRVVPYLALFPRDPAPAPPVVVAVHGVSRQKEDWLAAANALCAAGHVVVAIDLYQHGDRQADVALPEGDFADHIDPVLAVTGARFPDPFINPTFLARTRDKLRQSIVDHLALVRILATADGARPEVDLDGDGAPDDYGAIHLVGHSLGAILGAGVAAVSPDLDRVALSAPGASLVQIIDESPALGADLDLLLYATGNAPGFGLLAGSARTLLPDDGAREIYDRVAETLLSSADPLAWAPAILSGALGGARPRLLVQLAVGDLVVPNSANTRFARAVAAGAPTPEAFPQLLPVGFDTGLPTAMLPDGSAPVPGVTFFAGAHTHLLDWADPEVTAAAQAEVVGFLTAP